VKYLWHGGVDAVLGPAWTGFLVLLYEQPHQAEQSDQLDPAMQ
jgi:hypothetical protein